MRSVAGFIVAVFLGGCASMIAAQPRTSKPGLELRAERVGQSYCAAANESTSLTMELKLRYTNRTSEKVILYKGHDLFYQTRIRQAPNQPSGPHEVLYINSRYYDEEFEAIDRPSPGRVFVTLTPGESYERRMTIGIGMVGEKVERANDAIRRGEHTLQLIVSTWYKSVPLGQKLREQWRAKGHLWLEPLLSNSIPFVAERPQSIPACK